MEPFSCLSQIQTLEHAVQSGERKFYEYEKETELTITQLSMQCRDCEQSIEKLQEAVHVLSSDKSSLSAQLLDATRRSAALGTSNDELQHQLSQLKAECAQTEAELAGERQRLRSAAVEIKEQKQYLDDMLQKIDEVNEKAQASAEQSARVTAQLRSKECELAKEFANSTALTRKIAKNEDENVSNIAKMREQLDAMEARLQVEEKKQAAHERDVRGLQEELQLSKTKISEHAQHSHLRDQQLELLKTQLATAQRQLEVRGHDMTATEAENAKLEASIDSLKREIACAATRERDLESEVQKIQQLLEAEHQKTKEALHEIGKRDEALLDLRAETQRVAGQLKSANEELKERDAKLQSERLLVHHCCRLLLTSIWTQFSIYRAGGTGRCRPAIGSFRDCRLKAPRCPF